MPSQTPPWVAWESVASFGIGVDVSFITVVVALVVPG